MMTRQDENLLDTTRGFQDLIAAIERFGIRSIENMHGWVVSRPIEAEIDEHFEFFVARNKPGSSDALALPPDVEVCVGVLRGAITIDGKLGELRAGSFWVVRPRDERGIRALQLDTQITVQFFKGTGDDDGGLSAQRAA